MINKALDLYEQGKQLPLEMNLGKAFIFPYKWMIS